MHLVLMLIRLRCIVNARTGRETAARFAGLAFDNWSAKRSPFRHRYFSIGDRRCLLMKRLGSQQQLGDPV